MRLGLLFLTLFVGIVVAWSEQDTEIFHLQSLLKQHSPESASFYDLLSIPPTSKTKAIAKRFKQLSLKHHPDKVGTDNKENNEYYEFLQLAATILRDGEKRRTYDYYLKTGFPKFTHRGWGFYKFKPGTLLALGIIAIIVGLFQYAILWISYYTNVKRVEMLVTQIKSLDPNPTDFKEKRVFHPQLNQEFLIRVDGVFLVKKHGNWDDFTEKFVPVSPEEVDIPNWRDSLFVKGPVSLWNWTFGKIAFLHIELVRPKREKVVKEEPQEEKKKKKKVAKRLPNGKIVYKNKAD